MKSSDFPELSAEEVGIVSTDKSNKINKESLSESADADSSNPIKQIKHVSITLPPSDVFVGEYENQETHPSPLLAEHKRLLRDARKESVEELDLHQKTIVEAHADLLNFLCEAHQNGVQIIKVIHGRGIHSEAGKAVLRGRVRKWLAGCEQVRCYQSTDNHGAVLVVLKRT